MRLPLGQVLDPRCRALGMQAYLVDRDGRTDVPDALPTLLALPALIGVETDA